jgi:hypothetical protein
MDFVRQKAARMTGYDLTVFSSSIIYIVSNVHAFHLFSSQMQANSNPGQVWMSYSNGFAGSSPKFASKEDIVGVGIIVTAGKRRSTVGLIGNFRPANFLDLLGRHYGFFLN